MRYKNGSAVSMVLAPKKWNCAIRGTVPVEMVTGWFQYNPCAS
jgi:hypothetical protein